MSLDGLPGLAEVAIQSGRHAAAELRRRLDGETEAKPFRYRDLGSLAAVSRYYAIGERKGARVWGLAGWLMWLAVHLVFLTGFKNRISALFHWTVSFFGRSRPERTITAQQVFARQAIKEGGPRGLGIDDPASRVTPSDQQTDHLKNAGATESCPRVRELE